MELRATGALICTTGAVGFLHFILPVIAGDEEDGEEESTGNPQEQFHGSQKENNIDLPDSIDISLASQRSGEDAFFIPMSWARKCEVKPYRGSDPEWQEFLKFAHDRNRGIRVRRM
ncbi:MAG: hypothetical protein M1839_001546 [Geoglossum umbratile]|nr:MAG: hypothetical protein M1839_001546 [Geoglossum umbratile]